MKEVFMKIPNKILRTIYRGLTDMRCNADFLVSKDSLKHIKDIEKARIWLRQYRRKDFKF
jgi:hypothetical protein